MGVRRSALLAAVRSVRDSLVGAEYVKGLTAEELPDPSRFGVSSTFMKRPFAYVVKVQGENQLTGQLESRNITVSSENVLDTISIEEYVGDILEASFNTYQLAMDSYDIEQVLVDPRFVP